MSNDAARLMSRYVRPIYEAIDGRQYKAAIKLCTHKRVAHLDIVQVLKAHCLERTGRADEALDICRRLQRKQPTDDTLLNTMNLVFKLSGCEHEMLPTFEHACAVSHPPNEELYQSLFVSYARRGDFLKQQQTALKMFKAFGKVKYVCWAALSMMLQVEHGKAPARMLALAEKMLLKTLRESGSADGEALQLLVMIVQLQDNHQGALAAFDEFVTTNESKDTKKMTLGRAAEGEGAYEEEIELGPMQAIDRLSLEATLARNVANWSRCAMVTRRLLEEYNADDWIFLKQYFAARFEEKVNYTTEELLALGQDLTAFLDDLQSHPDNERIRGPSLACIHVRAEILSRLKVGDEAIPLMETKLQDCIIAYVERLHSKACCFTDLKQYFSFYLKESTLVSAAAKLKLAQHFCHLSEISANLLKIKPADDQVTDTTRKDGQGNLTKRLVALKSLRFLGYYETFSVDDLNSLVTELEDEYEATNWLNMASAGGQREVQLTDDLLLLATHFLLDICQRTSGCRVHLERAAGLLEYGLEKSAYNFQMKLLLIRVYGYLGAAEAMLARYADLDVKYVQLDSLAFLVLDKLLDFCQYPEAQKLTTKIAALHRSTANDTPEYIARAYPLGIYSKVIDMTSFLHKRMKKSHTLAISKGEALRFELLDAVTAGLAKLYEVVTSSGCEAQIAALESMLTSDGSELSYNQHREVIVDWNAQPQIPTGDFCGQDETPLVECDRSANVHSSFLWLKLRVVAPKLLQSIAEDDQAALNARTAEYRHIITRLHFSNSSGKVQPHQKLWQWSSVVMDVSVRLVNILNSQNADEIGVSAAFLSLQDDFASILTLLCADLTFRSAPEALSPYAVSMVSSLLSDAGLFSLSALALVHRAVSKKKGKKSEQLSAAASALRNLLKHMLESLVELQTHIENLHFPAPILSNELSSPKHLAQEKAHTNVVHSYHSLQKRMLELLDQRCSSIRTILQK
ncbi:hypothetical protein PsorP6_012862 [Peronosclerospora sorghi]|uniref:Uncharacterized protein n=1 Tax=Peronosclerospora sorghi TaxID=230839 RepID=A0ACC0WHH9_9STRA|nr:hypothetical protein PsorP6_012862 [Peronosclerospora sorghi]